MTDLSLVISAAALSISLAIGIGCHEIAKAIERRGEASEERK